MTGTPERLEVFLSSSSYHMEVDVKKDDCNRESAHWHLCQNGRRIGQIYTYGNWASSPDVSSSIRREAEELTNRYSGQIESVYDYNRQNGAG